MEILSAGGALRIPLNFAEVLKPQLGFWMRFTKEEEKTVPDWSNPGQVKVITVRSKVPSVERVNLYEEDEDWLWTHNGLFHRVEKLLTTMGIEVTCRRSGKSFASPVPTPAVVAGLYPEQRDCVRRLLSTMCGGMAENATGTGKTRIIASLCRAYPNSNILVVTRKRPVVIHLHRELNELVKGPDPEKPIVGIYLAGKKTKAFRINVCTAAMLGRPESVPRDWPDVIIFDECHGAAGQEIAEDLQEFAGIVKYGLSGTICKRWDNKELLLESIFGPIVSRLSDIDATELSRVVPLDVFVFRNNKGPLVSSTNPATQERQGITTNRTRNAAIKDVVDLIPDDQQAIIFVRTLEHARLLESTFLPGIEIFHGDLDPNDYSRILLDIESGALKRVIATNTLGEGVDPKALRYVIDGDWSSSRTSCIQRAGRVRRFAPGKTRGYLIAFSDEFDERFARKSVQRLGHYKHAGYNLMQVSSAREIFQVINSQQVAPPTDVP